MAHHCQRFNLAEADIRSAVMGEAGADIELSSLAPGCFSLAIECKNRERLNIWEALSQAEKNAALLPLVSLVVFKRNRGEVYCCLKWADFLDLL